jgi:hypothetical protein
VVGLVEGAFLTALSPALKSARPKAKKAATSVPKPGVTSTGTEDVLDELDGDAGAAAATQDDHDEDVEELEAARQELLHAETIPFDRRKAGLLLLKIRGLIAKVRMHLSLWTPLTRHIRSVGLRKPRNTSRSAAIALAASKMSYACTARRAGAHGIKCSSACSSFAR